MDIKIVKKYTGNRTASVFENFTDYCKESNLNVEITMKKISNELGTMCSLENNDLYITGHFNVKDVRLSLN
jgi:translation initiation factor 2 beta subunit (eIF-2beta)/eIF-5